VRTPWSWLRIIPLAAFATAASAGSGQALAYTKPITDESYYWDTTETAVAGDDGCYQGLLDDVNEQGSFVILDFGGQLGDGDGTRALTNTFNFSNTEIEAIAIEFALGYFVCTEGDLYTTLELAIGTNNDYEDVNKAGGEAWAKLVNRVDEVINETPEEALQVYPMGADDLEDGYSDGEAANQWATGYNEKAEAPMDDFGDAGGCPADSHDNGACTGG